MCLATVIPRGVEYRDDWFVQAWDSNPDGAGVAYAKDGKVIIEKGIWTPEELLLMIEVRRKDNPESDFLVHLRWANVGIVDDENTHPFAINDELAFIHNGTIRPCVPNKGDSRSDTQVFAEFAKDLPGDWVHNVGIVELVEDYIGTSKLAFIDGTGEAVIFNEHYGEWVDGVWMSNDYYTGDYERGTNGAKVKTLEAYNRDKEVATSNEIVTTYTMVDGAWVLADEVDDDFEDICDYCGKKLTNDYEKIYGMCDACASGSFYDTHERY